ncbi:MAG: OsmC family protein [Rhodospirillales bacterium]|nr:OsmC family protein [Rhodospirillales bacterium]
MSETVRVTVTRQDRYRFVVDFGPGIEAALGDEPAPLGEGAGPSPSQLLAAAVANCLSSSLVFAVNKYKEDPGRLTTAVTCEVGRNDKGRLRILGMAVEMTLGAEPETLGHLERALASFEEFCTVSQSVRAGIPFTVSVRAPDGRVLK